MSGRYTPPKRLQITGIEVPGKVGIFRESGEIDRAVGEAIKRAHARSSHPYAPLLKQFQRSPAFRDLTKQLKQAMDAQNQEPSTE